MTKNLPNLLVQLSRRLKCTIVIMCCLSSLRRPSVVVNFYYFDFSSEIQRNLTRSKILTSSTKFVLFGPLGKTRWLTWSDWLTHFRLLLLNGLTEYNETWQEDSTSSTKLVFFGLIGKTRWPPWPLIGWGIFDFSSETAERNSTKFDRKQDRLPILCFRVDQ